MEKSNPKILILIPVFNGATHLRSLIERIKTATERTDILIIDDGSSDSSADIAKEYNVTCLINENNMGKGYSLKRGFGFAVDHGYDYIITMDADLQHLPEELNRLIGSTQNGSIRIGTRELSLKKMPLPRWISNNVTSMIVSIFSGRMIRDSQSGFRLLGIEQLKGMKAESDRFDFESEILFQTGLKDIKVEETPISTVYNTENSSINHLADTIRFIRQIWRKIML